MRDYNRTAIDRGDYTPEMIRESLCYWQLGHGLPGHGSADGATRAAMGEVLGRRVGADHLYGRRGLEIAQREIGQGEEGGNNIGRALIRYRMGDGTGRPANVPHLWCASFLAYCLREAGYQGPTSRGALALFDLLEKNGGRRITEPVPGSIIAWRKPRRLPQDLLTRPGHIGISEEYDPRELILAWIDGNAGPAPQKVARRASASWPQDLYGILAI